MYSQRQIIVQILWHSWKICPIQSFKLYNIVDVGTDKKMIQTHKSNSLTCK